MTKLVAVAVLSGIAGSASANVLPFTIDAAQSKDDGGGVANTGLVTDGIFNQDTFGGDTAPNPALFPVFPSLAFDTYVQIGGSPETGGNEQRGTALAGFSFGTSDATGVWFRDAFSGVGPAPSSVNNDIFLGRFVGGNLSGQLQVGNLNENGAGTLAGDRNGFILFTIGDAPRAVAGATNLYALEVRQSSSSFGTVNDLYVVASEPPTGIPAPGAVGILGLAGLAAARRRR